MEKQYQVQQRQQLKLLKMTIIPEHQRRIQSDHIFKFISYITTIQKSTPKTSPLRKPLNQQLHQLENGI